MLGRWTLRFAVDDGDVEQLQQRTFVAGRRLHMGGREVFRGELFAIDQMSTADGVNPPSSSTEIGAGGCRRGAAPPRRQGRRTTHLVRRPGELEPRVESAHVRRNRSSGPLEPLSLLASPR